MFLVQIRFVLFSCHFTGGVKVPLPIPHQLLEIAPDLGINVPAPSARRPGMSSLLMLRDSINVKITFGSNGVKRFFFY